MGEKDIKNCLNAIKFAAGAALLVALFYFAGIGTTIGALASFDLAILYPVILLYILTVFMSGINVKILLDAHSRLGLLEFMKDYSSSWAAGSVLPGKVGDFSLAYLLKDRIAPAKSAGIILLDKLITLVILSLVGSASIALFLGAWPAAIAVGSLCVLWATGFLLLFTNAGKKFFTGILPQKLRPHFADFAAVFPHFIENEKPRIAANAALTLLKLAVQAGATVIIYLGLGEHVRIIDIFMITAASTIISFVPLTISGLGLKEGSFALLALRAGIPMDKTAAVIVVSTAINYAIVGIIMLGFAGRMIKGIPKGLAGR